MKRRLNLRELAAVASMLFGLYFGAGNLIFPVHMGQLAGREMLGAALGFIATGVGLPLLGIAALGASRSGGLQDMADRIGRRYSFFFTCVLYLTIGPFFAIPRCATTAFTVGIAPLTGDSQIALFIFSALFFAAVLFFSLRPSGILTWIGRVINPLFLGFLAVLIAASLFFPMGTISGEPAAEYASGSFFRGFLEGYNTMDAIASLCFGIVIIDVIRNLGIEQPGDIAANALRSGVFCCLMMGLIYALLTVMGARSTGMLELSVNGGIALAEIARHYFGGVGQFLLLVTVTLACFKTSIGLVTSCSHAFSRLFPQIGYRIWAVIFSAAPFLMSNFGLDAIIAWSLPVLMLLYPLCITLILLCLFGRFFGFDRRVFVAVTIPTFCAALLDFAGALSEGAQAALHTGALTEAAERFLPFYRLGLGWLVPALIGLCMGMAVRKLKKKNEIV